MFLLKLKMRGLNTAHTRRNFAIVAALFAVCFLFNASGVYAATFVVNTTVDGNDVNTADGICEATAGAGDCTLRAAITQANVLAGADVITLPGGTYTQTLVGSENANATGDFDIISDITINGGGSGFTFIESATTTNTAVERVLHFLTAGTSTINGVTIRNGKTTSGTFAGGVRVEGTVNVTFNNTIVRDNVALGRGGGIYVISAGSVLTMNNCTVTNNQSLNIATGTSVGGAGIYQNNGTTTLNNTAVNGNTSAVAGSTNTTPPSAVGGGITVFGGTMNLNSSSVNSNIATNAQTSAFGGGILMSGATTTVTLTDSTVNNNVASVTAGTGGSTSGGIDHEGGTLTLNRSTVSGNTAGDSGGIRVIAFTNAATANINQSAIINNTGTGGGGGIFNIAAGAGNATTTLNNSTVGGNMTNLDGGGVQNFSQSTGSAAVNINYSTVAANTADADANGTGNGGGLANFGQAGTSTGTGTITLQSSIVADNVNLGGTSADIVNTITSLGYNHVENTTGGTFTTMVGDVTGTDPGLLPLANNAFTVPSYKPSAASPVIDSIMPGMGNCGVAPFNIDQRGFARPTDSNGDTILGCEKGSVEVLSPTAAGVSISGQVLTGSSSGKTKARGIANAVVTMIDGSGNTRVTRTNSFGYYSFDDIEVGQTYIFYVSARRYQFGTQAISINNELTNYNFTANE